MRKVLTIATAVCADAIRRKVVWVVVLFAGLLAVAAPSLPSYGVGVDAAVYREVSIALMWVASLIVVLALAAPRIPSEVERRTVYSVLGRDVPRWQYVLGTWLGVFAVMFAVIGAFTLVAIGVGAVRYGALQWRLVEAGVAVWLESGIIGAFAVLMSTFSGTFTTIAASLVFVFVGHAYRGLLPEQVARFAPSLDTFNVVNPVAHGSGVNLSLGLVMAASFAVWVAALLAAGTLVFDRKDL